MIRIAACLLLFCSVAVSEDESYPTHPDMLPKDGVPQGKVTRGTFDESSVFPGTTREYGVYVPAQYDGSKSAALMVFQDGMAYMKVVPTMFDNLIDSGDMPVTIGLFVNPGIVPAAHEKAQPRYNRSFEFDTVDGRYAKFLLEELMPVALKGLNITDDPNLRGSVGASTGGIAAFTLAWERPDQFRRVFSQVGSYVGLRGGNELPVLVRKTEPKPIRVFLQSGTNDNDLYCGSWWAANEDMLSALTWAGYEVNHDWGDGGHNRKHGYAIFPDVMRWLWGGWETEPVISNHPVADRKQSTGENFLVEGEDWELVSEGHLFTEGPAVNENGELFFTDLEGSKIWRVGKDGNETLFKDKTGGTNGLAFAPDGKTLYGCQRVPGRLVSWDIETGEVSVHVEDVRPNDVVVAHDGTVYFSNPGKKEVWVIPPGEEARVAASEYSGVNGVLLSVDQSLVFGADYPGRFVWSGQRKTDGTLAYNQPYFHLHLPPASLDIRSHADGMAMSREGWLLVATSMGVQICDQPGRVNFIIPQPLGERHPSNVFLFENTLYATCGTKVFKRKIKLTGAPAWEPPGNPGKPQL
ncbi:MAG: SMP-30/gluconolactonase/LRE family protein [Verrucomicrobiales bacterium]